MNRHAKNKAILVIGSIVALGIPLALTIYNFLTAKMPSPSNILQFLIYNKFNIVVLLAVLVIILFLMLKKTHEKKKEAQERLRERPVIREEKK